MLNHKTINQSNSYSSLVLFKVGSLIHREAYELVIKMLIVHLFTDIPVHFKIGKLEAY